MPNLKRKKRKYEIYRYITGEIESKPFPSRAIAVAYANHYKGLQDWRVRLVSKGKSKLPVWLKVARRTFPSLTPMKMESCARDGKIVMITLAESDIVVVIEGDSLDDLRSVIPSLESMKKL